MKIQFRCKQTSFELSNFLLAEAVRSLEAYPERLKELGLSVDDLEFVKEFRNNMVKSVTGKTSFNKTARVNGKL